MSRSKVQPKFKPQVRAEHFAQVRKDHSTEIIEDYVELIAELSAQQNEVRAVDIARYFGVSQATVNKTINRLVDEGLVESAPYRAIFLTDSGKELAAQCRERHDLVVNWLLSLGIDNDVAHCDAEGIEHHISKETLTAIQNYLSANGYNT